MSHNCPMCQRVPIPTYRALCLRCFDVLPWQERADFLHAYRFRAANQLYYQDTFIRVRQLYLEKQARPIRKQSEISDPEDL